VRALFVTVAILAATTAVWTSPAHAASACAPPSLGFGVGEGANDSAMPPSTGELRIAMLFVDFADLPARASADALIDAYVPAVADWYRGASYGRLRLVVDPLRRWLRMPRSLAEYDRAHFVGAIEDVLSAADPHYDFSGVDALYLMTSEEAGTRASTVVDHEPRQVEGSDIRAWVWFASGRPETPRPAVLVHETGHVLGLPDLYDIRRPGNRRHHWDIMSGSNGAGMLGWHRWKLGWLQASEVVCLPRRRPLITTLSPLGRRGGRKAIVHRTANAAVVVEVRARVGVDASLCRGGVLVYRVDFRRGAPASLGLLGVPIDIWPAKRGDSSRCGADWRAPLAVGRGEIARATAFGLRIRILARLRDGSYRIRVTTGRGAATG
jgi:M6 family metalloprotease-like protein